MDEKNEQKTTSAALRDWTRRARADGLMDLSELDAITDRIDAETVELPKDEDGVPIHVGDIVWGCISGTQMAVHELRLKDRWTISTDTGFIPKASAVTHIRPDSLERIADELDAWVDRPASYKEHKEFHTFAERIRKLAKEQTNE